MLTLGTTPPPRTSAVPHAVSSMNTKSPRHQTARRSDLLPREKEVSETRLKGDPGAAAIGQGFKVGMIIEPTL